MQSKLDADIAIIGGGAVGAACAYTLSKYGLSIIVLEKERTFASKITGHNPGVVHSGCYYAPGSMRARVAVRGNKLLWEFVKKYNVPHRRCGKFIIANTENQLSALEKVVQNGQENGVKDLIVYDQKFFRKMVPNVVAKAALFSKSTGIFDGIEFTHRLIEVAQSKNVIVAHSTKFTNAIRSGNFWRIITESQTDYKPKVRYIVNAAGLSALNLRNQIFPHKQQPKIFWEKGSFACSTKKNLFKHIVINATVPGFPEPRVDCIPRLDGITQFGPVCSYLTKPNDWSVAENTVDLVFSSVRNFLPTIQREDLQPYFAGISPKLEQTGNSSRDLIIEKDTTNSWIDLLGLSSPSLSAILAIGEQVQHLITEMS